MKHGKPTILLLLCFLISWSGCEKTEDLYRQDAFITIPATSITSNSFTSIWATRKDASALITLRYDNLDILYKQTDTADYPNLYEVYLSINNPNEWEKICTIDTCLINSAHFVTSFIISGLTNDEIHYIYLKEITNNKEVRNTNVAVFIPSSYKPAYDFITEDYYDHDIYSFGINTSNNKIVYATKYYEYDLNHAAPAVFISESDNEPELVDINCWFPDFNSTGTKISYSSDKGEIFDGNIIPEHITIYNIKAREKIRITSGYSVNKFPAWSPDNSLIAFSSSEQSDQDLRIALLNTATHETSILTSESDLDNSILSYSQEHPAWGKDGKYIYYTHRYFTNDNLNPGNYDIYRINTDDGTTEPVFNLNGIECAPAISPDNSKLAFLTDLSGKLQIWIYDFKDQKYSQPFDNDVYSFSETWSQIKWENNNTVLFTGYSEDRGGEDALFSISVE